MRIFEPHPATERALPAWERTSAHWRANGLALLETVLARQIDALAWHVPQSQWSLLLELLEELHGVDAPASLAVANQIDMLVQRLGVEGLRRWMLTGMRLHGAEGPQALRRYFALQSRAAVEALHTEEGGASLVDSLPALGWLWGMLAEDGATVQALKQNVLYAAPARPVLQAEHGLFLLDNYTALDGVDRWNLLRAAVAHAAAHWRYSPRKQSGRGLKPMGHAVVGAMEDARVEFLFEQEFPGVHRWFAQAFAPTPEAVQRADLEGMLARLHWALADAAHEDDNGWIVKARTLFDRVRHAGDLSRPEPLREAASILANDLGQLRLRMNLQTFHVPAPYRDDNSFLWDFGENAAELPGPQEVQKEWQQTAATARFAPDTEPPGNDEQQVLVSKPVDPIPFFYPEWDYRLERFRQDWCTVYERLPPLDIAGHRRHEPLAWRPQSRRAKLRTDRHVRLRAQWQGDDLDLDATIRWEIDRRAQSDPSPRIFRDAGRALPQISVLVLVDLSESCNDHLPESTMSLLDLQKRALRLLAERLNWGGTRLAIHGFHSDTRKSVSYFRMLEFGQRFDSQAATMLDALRAGYSTRLGAALRHATQLAARETSTHRAIVVLSDGMPSDIDVFDAHYLVADARAAVHAARRAGVDVAALAVGEVDFSRLRGIYGHAGYCAVRDPLELPVRLLGLMKRLMR